jgi:MscS family membrane protein
MMSVVRLSHSSELSIRFCIFFLFAAMVLFIGIPEGLCAPQKAPTVKDLMEEEPKEVAKPRAPVVESTSQTVTKGIVKGAEKAEVAPQPPPPPVDEYDPGIPRNAVKGFFWACGERDFERAAEYLDLRYLPRGLDGTKGPELARKLYIIFTRSIWIDIAHLSDRPEGHQEDGLPPYRDRLGGIETDEKKYDLYLQQVSDDKGKTVWKISNRTVGQIPELYARFGHGILEDKLPLWVFDFHIWGIYVWEWVALVIGLAGSIVLVLALTSPIFFLLRRWDTKLSRQLLQDFSTPLRFLLIILFVDYWLVLINPSFTVKAVLHAGTFRLIAFSWLLIRVTHFSLEEYVQRSKRKGQDPSPVLIPVFGNAIKIVVIITAVMLWLDNLGFQVTAILAGLGIGGLAVALAAQKSLENFFGAITLYSSKPVRIGDFCRFGDRVGTIEEIGLRSTLVRTLDDTTVSVPNGEFSNRELENYTRRRKIWYHPRIRLRYDTTPDQLRYILVEIRKVLYGHPKVLPDLARIRFVGFGESSLDLDIFAYIDVTDYGESLEVAEDLNLRIMGVIAKAGSGFALPQTLYMERSKGLDNERAREAEAEVTRWKEEQALYLPNFPLDKISSLRGSLDYPPVGSPDAMAKP